MSNEFAINDGFMYANGLLEGEAKQRTYEIDQVTSTPKLEKRVVTVATSEADISLGGVTAPGMIRLTNLDSTHYVEVGPKSGGAMVPFARLRPGDAPARFWLAAGVTLRAKATTAACDVLLEAFDE